MKNKKLVVLLSVLAIATTPVVVAMAGCDGNKPDNKTEQTTKYTFSFSGGSGATGSVAAIADKATGDKFNLPENGFTKDGYTFAGWSDGTATTPYAAGAEYTVGTSNVTFTAVWTAIDYTVTFAGGDGATGTVAAITGKHVGDKVTLPESGFTKEGYTFVGWLVGTSETPVAAGTEITMTAANVTVTAAWEETTFKVTFAGGDGATGSIDAITGKKEGDVVTLPENTFEKTGYKFMGWSVGGETKAAGDEITVGTADVAVTAVWAKVYSVTFVGGDDTTGSVDAITDKFEGDEITLPSNKFVKTGYKFMGWSIGGETKKAGSKITIGTADVVATAVWAKTYTVTFAGGDGATGTVSAIANKIEGDVVTLPANKFSKAGFQFMGWSIGGETKAAGEKITIGTADIEATAIWEACYTDALEGKITAIFKDGKVTVYNTSWNGTVYASVYNCAVDGTTVTFTDTEDSSKTYTGALFHDAYVAVLPVFGGYSYMDTALVFTESPLTLIDDMGTNAGCSQSYDMTSQLYMYSNNLVFSKKRVGSYPNDRTLLDYGTYESKGGHVYTVSLEGKTAFDVKIEITQYGVSFYQANDGFNGTYTFGEQTVVLDGYGAGKCGEANITYGVMGTMIYISNPDENEEGIYAIDSAAKTINATNKMSDISYINYGEYGYSVAYYDGTYFGYMETDEGGNTLYTAINVADDKSVAVFADGVIIDYTGYQPRSFFKCAVLAAGNYVDNLNSGVTATVAEGKLTVTDGTNSMVYTINYVDGRIQLKPTSGNNVTPKYVNGVISFNAKLGDATKSVALSATALESIDGMAAGYAVNKNDDAEKTYFYKNGIAITATASSVKTGVYTVDESIYTVLFAESSSGKTINYKVTLDADTVPASYESSDIFGGSYTFDDYTLVLNGFGAWTDGTNSGTYKAFQSGYQSAVVLYKDGVVHSVYSYNSYMGSLELADLSEDAMAMTASAKANQTKYLSGIVFDDNVDIYDFTGIAVITYTANGTTTSVLVTKNDTFTIGDVTFTVTAVDSSQVRFKFTTTENDEPKDVVIAYEFSGGVG